MACDNLNKYFLIVMNFSGYLPSYEDTSATDFGPDRSIRLAGHAPKVGHNELHCSSVCVWSGRAHFKRTLNVDLNSSDALTILNMLHSAFISTIISCYIIFFCNFGTLSRTPLKNTP